MDGTMYFPPVYIKFRRQTARGMEAEWKRTARGIKADWKRTGSRLEADINILIYKLSGIWLVLGMHVVIRWVLNVVGDS